MTKANAPIPGMLLEGTMQVSGHALQICGPETGHTVRDIAFFSDSARAADVARALNAHNDLLAALKHIMVDFCVSDLWIEMAKKAIDKAELGSTQAAVRALARIA